MHEKSRSPEVVCTYECYAFPEVHQKSICTKKVRSCLYMYVSFSPGNPRGTRSQKKCRSCLYTCMFCFPRWISDNTCTRKSKSCLFIRIFCFPRDISEKHMHNKNPDVLLAQVISELFVHNLYVLFCPGDLRETHAHVHCAQRSPVRLQSFSSCVRSEVWLICWLNY